ncbi:hypothetical protein FPV67DRAFT_1450215 [Lyophyllum atratum]|nr:hypothetical protein FPV67DRAFT_1450215 [Lyophyllum atratum]
MSALHNLRTCGPAGAAAAPAGPSKGKTVDPTNWGTAGVEPQELSIEAQKRALETWARAPYTVEMTPGRDLPLIPDALEPAPARGDKTDLKRTQKVGNTERPAPGLRCVTAWVEDASDDEAPMIKKPSKPTQADIMKRSSEPSWMPNQSRLPTPLSETMAQKVAEVVGASQRAKSQRASKVASITPLSQITPEGYLGQALRAVKRTESKKLTSKHAEKPSRHDPPSSTSSSSDSGKSSPTQSMSSSSGNGNDVGVHGGESMRASDPNLARL